MATEAENEARRLRGEPPVTKALVNPEDETAKKAAEEAKAEAQRQKLLDQAEALIKSGLDPKQVGAFMLGAPGAMSGTYIPPSNGLDTIEQFAKILAIMDKRNDGKGSDAAIERLERRLEKMQDEAERKSKKGEDEHVDPMAVVIQQAQMMSEWRKVMIDMGIVADPRAIRPAAPQTGESIESLKEKNRHEEKMEEVKATKAYHDSLIELGSSIPERIGRGAANQVRENATRSVRREQPADSPQLESMKCPDCGETIYITPDSKLLVTCGKCGAIWERHEIQPKQPPVPEDF